MNLANLIDQLFNRDKSDNEVKSSFIVTKDLVEPELYRWFAWVTNKWEDREEQILTDKAHREFEQFLNNNPEKAPELWVWHTPGTAREHKADWWHYKNGFFMYSGLLTHDEATPYIKQKVKAEPLGMSHGFFVLEQYGPFIEKYRTFELTELPLDLAANAHTQFEIMEVEMKFDDRKRAFLEERLGPDVVARLESATEEKEDVLEELGTSWKEVNKEWEDKVATEKAAQVAEAAEGTVKAVVASVMEAMNLEGLQAILQKLATDVEGLKELTDRVVTLENHLKEMEATQDEKIAEALTPAEPFAWDMSVRKNEMAQEKPVTEAVNTAKKEFDWLEGFKQ